MSAPPAVVVRQAVLADLDAATMLFDAYRRFQGRPADLPAARAFLRERFEHGQSVVLLAHGAAPGADWSQAGEAPREGLHPGRHVGRREGRREGPREGEPLGFAQLYPSFSSVALARVFILNDLFVAEAGRRKGVASALLAAVEAHAWAHGACRVTLNVARDNLEGQALYRARGWTQDAQFHMFHRFPADA